MQKLFILVTAISLASITSSCKKSYSCGCKVYYTSTGAYQYDAETQFYEETSKDKAESKCYAIQTDYQSDLGGSQTYTVQCALN